MQYKFDEFKSLQEFVMANIIIIMSYIKVFLIERNYSGCYGNNKRKEALLL